MYTYCSIANSQKMLTEINESGDIAKIKIWVKSDNVEHSSHLEQFLAKWKFLFLVDVLIVFIFRE